MYKNSSAADRSALVKLGIQLMYLITYVAITWFTWQDLFHPIQNAISNWPVSNVLAALAVFGISGAINFALWGAITIAFFIIAGTFAGVRHLVRR